MALSSLEQGTFREFIPVSLPALSRRFFGVGRGLVENAGAVCRVGNAVEVEDAAAQLSKSGEKRAAPFRPRRRGSPARQRIAQQKPPRPPREPSRRPHYITRARLQCGKRIGVGDLPPQDKHFTDWLNARQTAWLLNTTMKQVYRLRDTGRIRALKDPAAAPRNCRWLFRKADVDKLMNDPEHCKGRYHYARYCTPEAIARNKAKREQQAEIEYRDQLDSCVEASLRMGARQGSLFAAAPPE